MFLFRFKLNKPNYVYVFCDGRKQGPFIYGSFTFKYEPFYIGKGSGNRLQRHIKKSHNRFINRKVDSIEQSGFTRKAYKVFDNLTEYQALYIEMLLIKQIGRFDLKTGPLLNGTVGGESIIGRFVTEDTKALARVNAIKQMSSMTQIDIDKRAKIISQGMKKAYREGRINARENALRISEGKRRAGNYWLKLSIEDQNRLSKLRSKNAKDWYNNLSEKEKQHFKEKAAFKSKQVHNSMSEERKVARAEKIRQTLLKRYANMSEEDKLKRSINMSKAQRKRYSTKPTEV